MKIAAHNEKINTAILWLNNNHFNVDYHVPVNDNVEHIVFEHNIFVTPKELIMLKEYINEIFKSASNVFASQKLLFGDNEELISIDGCIE